MGEVLSSQERHGKSHRDTRLQALAEARQDIGHDGRHQRIHRFVGVEGHDFAPLSVDYPVGTATFACEIADSGPDYIIVESPRRFAMKCMRESVISLTGEIILYLNDPRNRPRQSAHGSRFKVKFTRPPSAK